MSISDDLMWRYYLLLTDLPPSPTIDGSATRVCRAARCIRSRPRSTWRSASWGTFTARRGRSGRGGVRAPDSREARLAADTLPEVGDRAARRASIGLAKLVVAAGLAASSSDASRKIQQGGVQRGPREGDGYQGPGWCAPRGGRPRGRPTGGPGGIQVQASALKRARLPISCAIRRLLADCGQPLTSLGCRVTLQGPGCA